MDFDDIPGLVTPKPLKTISAETLAELKYGNPELVKQALLNLSPALEKSMRKREMAARTSIANGDQVELINDAGLDAEKHAYALGWNSVLTLRK